MSNPAAVELEVADLVNRLSAEIAALTRRAIVAEAERDKLRAQLTASEEGEDQ